MFGNWGSDTAADLVRTELGTFRRIPAARLIIAHCIHCSRDATLVALASERSAQAVIVALNRRASDADELRGDKAESDREYYTRQQKGRLQAFDCGRLMASLSESNTMQRGPGFPWFAFFLVRDAICFAQRRRTLTLLDLQDIMSPAMYKPGYSLVPDKELGSNPNLAHRFRRNSL